MRVSQKLLQICVDNLNHYTKHKANIFLTQGCGVYLTIDDIEYDKKVKGKEDCRTGITNKKAYDILKQYDSEIMEGYKNTKEV